jgi:hypothetical protein
MAYHVYNFQNAPQPIRSNEHIEKYFGETKELIASESYQPGGWLVMDVRDPNSRFSMLDTMFVNDGGIPQKREDITMTTRQLVEMAIHIRGRSVHLDYEGPKVGAQRLIDDKKVYLFDSAFDLESQGVDAQTCLERATHGLSADHIVAMLYGIDYKINADVFIWADQKADTVIRSRTFEDGKFLDRNRGPTKEAEGGTCCSAELEIFALEHALKVSKPQEAKSAFPRLDKYLVNLESGQMGCVRDKIKVEI